MKLYNYITVVKWLLIGHLLFLGITTTLIDFKINGDGVSYIEIAERVAKGDIDELLNAYWSPLYPSIIAIFLKIFNPNDEYLFFTVQIVNFLIYCCTMLSFRYFIVSLFQYQGLSESYGKYSSRVLKMNELFSICIFSWLVTFWISLDLVTPDLLVTLFSFIVAGQTLKLITGQYDKSSQIFMLGFTLGGGYLAKAPFLFLALGLVAVTYLHQIHKKGSFRKCLLIVFGFGIIAIPWIVNLSLAKERVTYSDSGKLNYVWYVNQSAPNRNWQGSDNTGSPLHGSKVIHSNPKLFVFDSPFNVTYPLWYDPSYYNEGIKIYFDILKQFQAVKYNFNKYCEIFLSFSVGFTFPICLLFVFSVSTNWNLYINKLFGLTPLVLFCLSALALYALVHLELRFIGGFVVILLSCLWFSANLQNHKIVDGVLYSVFFVALLAGPFRIPFLNQTILSKIEFIFNSKSKLHDPYNKFVEVAHNNMIERNDRFVLFGGNTNMSVIAKRIGIKIVGEALLDNFEPHGIVDQVLFDKILVHNAQGIISKIPLDFSIISTKVNDISVTHNNNAYYIYRFVL